MELSFNYAPYHAKALTPEVNVNESNFFGWNISTIESEGKKIIAVGAPSKAEELGKVYIFGKNVNDESFIEKEMITSDINIIHNCITSQINNCSCKHRSIRKT